MSAFKTQNYSDLPTTKSLQVINHLTNSTNVATILCHRYEQLLRSEKYYDCVFHVGTATLKCHKLILAAASPVFEAMFYGPIREKKQEIEILDISPDIFYDLLSYIYTGLVNFEKLSIEETIELYYGAEKYLLTDLISNCLVAIKRKLRFANILPALELSICMNLQGLLEICFNFFEVCCLNDPQYMVYLKRNYMHISKECIKTIIASTHDLKHLLWFVLEWCQQECTELGLQKSDCNLIINDLQLNAKLLQDENMKQHMGLKHTISPCKTIERSYYKACRPFIIDCDMHEWQVIIKCDRFISLLGIIINSRLMPSHIVQTNSPLTMSTTASTLAITNLPTEYNENLNIEIHAITNPNTAASNSSANSDNEENGNDYADEQNKVIWRYTLKKLSAKYNCDLNIQWDEGVILSPDIEYQIKMIWETDAYGAEYPCSLQSNEVDGIKFRDYNAYWGSFIKGLRYISLV